jgi:acetyl esterase/lipase
MRWGLIAVSLIAALSFLRPWVEAAGSADRARTALNAEFGASEQSPKPSLLRAFWAAREAAVEPKRLEFAPELFMDYYPAQTATRAPWVIVIHGGGWDSGDSKQLPELNSHLARRGTAVASIDYRLAPKFQWPAPKDDVLNAIRFVKAHADELKIDPSRFVILGRSAGGQIAESVAFSLRDPGLKGCIAFYAPSDLAFAYQYSSEEDVLDSRSLLRAYLGGSLEDKSAAFKEASPLAQVDSRAPPTLLIHGLRDNLVWSGHSQRLYERLQALHIPSTYVELPWATHGFDYTLRGPGGQLSTGAIDRFLKGVFSR